MEENDRLVDENSSLRKNEREGNSMELKTGLGTLRTSGGITVIIVGLFLTGAAIWYQVGQHDEKGGLRAADIRSAQVEIQKGQVRVEKAINNMAWILTQTETERKKLNLAMPEDLRRQLNRGRGEE